MSEKASKGTFLTPEKLQIHSNEGKGKEEKKKKAMIALLVFIITTLEFLAEKNCWTQKVYLAIRFSKIRLDIRIFTMRLASCTGNPGWSRTRPELVCSEARWLRSN